MIMIAIDIHNAVVALSGRRAPRSERQHLAQDGILQNNRKLDIEPFVPGASLVRFGCQRLGCA